MIRDIAFIAGLVLLAAGLTHRFGWDIACITVGAVMIAFVIFGGLKK